MQARALKFLGTTVPRLNMCLQYSYTGSSAQNILSELSETFKLADISEPSLSAELLVGEVLGVTNLDKLPQVVEHSQLNLQQSEELTRMAQCRLAQMPIQYILGYWDFRNIRLKMRPPVFIPRSETEELVGIVLHHFKRYCDKEIIHALEIGCGSGAISLSLLDEHQTNDNILSVLAVDQSGSACNLTLENAIGLNLLHSKGSAENVLTKGEHSNTLEVLNMKLTGDSDKCYGLEGKVYPNQMDAIVSNPPYVLRKDLLQLDPQITLYEDLRALDGGKDGLQVIENIVMLSNLILKPECYLFLEIDPCHTFLMPNLLEATNAKRQSTGYMMALKSISKDYQGKDRFAVLQKCIL